MANMDVYVNKGKSDVQDKLKAATDEVKRMGDEFKETKDGLSGMPGGLDSDIQSMIHFHPSHRSPTKSSSSYLQS